MTTLDSAASKAARLSATPSAGSAASQISNTEVKLKGRRGWATCNSSSDTKNTNNADSLDHTSSTPTARPVISSTTVTKLPKPGPNVTTVSSALSIEQLRALRQYGSAALGAALCTPQSAGFSSKSVFAPPFSSPKSSTVSCSEQSNRKETEDETRNLISDILLRYCRAAEACSSAQKEKKKQAKLSRTTSGTEDKGAGFMETAECERVDPVGEEVKISSDSRQPIHQGKLAAGLAVEVNAQTVAVEDTVSKSSSMPEVLLFNELVELCTTRDVTTHLLELVKELISRTRVIPHHSGNSGSAQHQVMYEEVRRREFAQQLILTLLNQLRERKINVEMGRDDVVPTSVIIQRMKESLDEAMSAPLPVPTHHSRYSADSFSMLPSYGKRLEFASSPSAHFSQSSGGYFDPSGQLYSSSFFNGIPFSVPARPMNDCTTRFATQQFYPPEQQTHGNELNNFVEGSIAPSDPNGGLPFTIGDSGFFGSTNVFPETSPAFPSQGELQHCSTSTLATLPMGAVSVAKPSSLFAPPRFAEEHGGERVNLAFVHRPSPGHFSVNVSDEEGQEIENDLARLLSSVSDEDGDEGNHTQLAQPLTPEMFALEAKSASVLKPSTSNISFSTPAKPNAVSSPVLTDHALFLPLSERLPSQEPVETTPLMNQDSPISARIAFNPALFPSGSTIGSPNMLHSSTHSLLGSPGALKFDFGEEHSLIKEERSEMCMNEGRVAGDSINLSDLSFGEIEKEVVRRMCGEDTFLRRSSKSGARNEMQSSTSYSKCASSGGGEFPLASVHPNIARST